MRAVVVFELHIAESYAGVVADAAIVLGDALQQLPLGVTVEPIRHIAIDPIATDVIDTLAAARHRAASLYRDTAKGGA